MKTRFLPIAVLAASGLVQAGDLSVQLSLPQLNVAEYHRPYVAIWVEQPDQKVAANLAVWYDLKKKDNGGGKWLKDLRQWWRKGGRDLTLPMDGLSGATRGVGDHSVTFNGSDAALATLAAGRYQLVVEAAREGGGRELVRLPFEWPGKNVQKATVKGREELGLVSLQIKP